MSRPAQNWDDLKTRTMTGVALAAVAAFAVWAGALWFLAVAAVATGVMFWEMAHIVGSDRAPLPVLYGLAGGLAVGLAGLFPDTKILWAVLALVIIFEFGAKRLKNFGTIYIVAIMVAVFVLISLRDNFGADWLLWLVLVVIASDVAGYLVGRAAGGPKFWPRLSPKKTWSGTGAGWVAAALVGALMAPVLGGGYSLIWISVALAFAGQIGDIAESALKRKAGIKDSSTLLPGHGGLLDRLDALIGASLGLLLIWATVGLPT